MPALDPAHLANRLVSEAIHQCGGRVAWARMSNEAREDMVRSRAFCAVQKCANADGVADIREVVSAITLVYIGKVPM